MRKIVRVSSLLKKGKGTMIQRIRQYVDDLFKDAPHTKKAMDLKEEVCSNLIDKYVDLTGHGVSDEDAYNEAIAGIGDIDELFAMMKDDPQQEDPQVRRRSALLVSAAVCLYILSFIPVIITDATAGVVAMFACWAIATALLVYNGLSRPKYQRIDDTMVEEFKEWKQRGSQQTSLYRELTGILWTLIVIIYFFISFTFGCWAVSWIIFLIGAAVQQIIRAYINLKR